MHPDMRRRGPPDLGGAKEENFLTNLFDLCFSMEPVCWKCSDKSGNSDKLNKNPTGRRLLPLVPPLPAKTDLYASKE